MTTKSNTDANRTGSASNAQEEHVSSESNGRKPDFKGDGVAVWINTAKNGNKYLSIKVTGHEKIIAFENE
jgi:hypothetical protein